MSKDAELVTEIRRGSLEAFEALYHKYKGQIFRTALAITRDQGAAEDILQDCFLRAYRHMDRVDGSASLSPWLHRIAINLSRTWLSKHNRWYTPLEKVVDQLVSPLHNQPDHLAEQKDFMAIVHEAMDSLSFNHRVTLILFYLWGYNLTEIAYIMDCPVGTVKSRLHYGRQNLRRKLVSDEELSRELAYEFT
jgi:RNA polymerase sigma-70 factor (ECF subfamily)